MATQLELQAADLKHTELGQKGAVLLTSTEAITGNFRKIQALTATVFTTLTSNITLNGVSSLATGSDFSTLAAGISICGKFTAVTLTSGIAILYK